MRSSGGPVEGAEGGSEGSGAGEGRGMNRPVSDSHAASLEEVEGLIVTYYACRECREACGAMTGEWEAVA